MTVHEETAIPSITRREAQAIGVEAYVYLYPLVLMEITRRQMTNVPAGTRPAFGPMGQFSHVREFPPADFKVVVRPNFDTLYSTAWLDLTAEPAIVSVPDTHGRYYLLPMLDMWTEVFAAPGSRTTGTQAANFAVLPPGWRGDLPDDVTVIQAPTQYVWIIGRTQTNGPSDYRAVNDLQDGMSITPLSNWGTDAIPGPSHIDPTVDTKTPPPELVAAMPARDFFGLATRLLSMHATHGTDWSILARMRRVGLRPGDLDYDTLDPTVRQALDEAPAAGLALMRETTPRMARVVNGWQMNTDTMGVYGNSYLKRAIIALVGLGANQPEDAIYPLNITDAAGQPLNGENDYLLHFERDEIPPVHAFWSVTMYDEEGFQAANAIDRFAIGDRDPLVYKTDGSLDLYLQHASPGPEREPNWLPAPEGPLGVTLRLYYPASEALDGRWNPPPIKRSP